MDKQIQQMLARARRIEKDQSAIRLEILRAVFSLTRLSGFHPHNTLENLQMGDLAYAIKIKQMYTPGVLCQARAILDSSQGMANQDDCDPITPSLEYGQTKKAFLERIGHIALHFSTQSTSTNVSNTHKSPKDKL